MNKLIISAYLGIVLLLPFNLLSQIAYQGSDAEAYVVGSEKVVINPKNKSLAFVILKNSSYIEEKDHLNWVKTNVLKLNSDYELVLYKTEKDELGYTHYRYREFYKGIKVEHGVYYVHAKNGRVISANGEFYPNISQNISTINAAVSSKDALQKAKSAFNSPLIQNVSKNENELTIIFHNNVPFICYHFELSANKPLKHSEIYVDARSNKVILELNKIHTTDVTGTLVTQFNGTKTATIDQVSASLYRLQQSSKNITTKNCNSSTNQASAVDFTNTTTNWTATNAIDKSVFDLHYGLEKTHDYYSSKFSRNSYDGLGTQIQGLAHYDYQFNNAFWDGTYMVFGDGDGVNYNPFSSTDVVGHELTHAVTESSAGLVYSDESGGLNESFSDIMGVSVDFFANPSTANFLEGEQCSITNTPFRDMTNPKATFQPNTYLGQYWVAAGGSDNGGVHTNSQVQNYWYYLLCQGGNGTNDNSVSYSISGIGITNAEKIVYRNLTTYLTPNSTYADARTYAIQSAIDLYGACSSNVTQCANAWYAVGVGAGFYNNSVVSQYSSNNNYSCSIPAIISFSNNSSNASSYKWDFGDGGVSTLANPTHTYTSAGNYSVKLKSIGTSSCNTSDSITKNNFVTVTNTGMPITACVSTQGNNSSSYGITKVEFGSISKTSLDASEGNKDFVCTNQTTLIAGNPYLLKVTTQAVSEKVSVWIDYNNDGVLNASNELIFNSTNPLNNIITHTMVVHTPTNAILNTPLRLRVSDDYTSLTNSCANHTYGQTEDYTVRFTAVTAKPLANFYSNTRITPINSYVNFYDSSLNAPTSYRWEFQGGTPSTSTTQNPNIYYSAAGTYSVKLVATNSFGADSITKTSYITVVNSFSLCVGTASTSASAGNIYDSGGSSGSYQNNENCQFIINPGCTGTVSISFSQFATESCCDQLSIYNGTTTASPLLGSYAGTNIPPTLYASSGKMLLVWYSDGSATYTGFSATWTSTLSGTIPPVADFSIATTNPPLSTPIQFADLTTNAPYQWLWQFGDGTTDNVKNPVKTYSTSGVKTITLTATNCNTTSISSKTINVQSAPNLSVSPSNLSGSVNCGDSLIIPLTLTNNGSGDLVYNSSIAGSSLDSVKVLICTYGVDMTVGGDYAKTLSAISSYYSKYSVSQYSGNTSSGLTTALTGKDVVLFPRQSSLTDTHYATYTSALNTFVSGGGSVIFCGSNGSLGTTRPFNSGLFTGTYGGVLTSYAISVLLPNDSLTYGIGVSSFNGNTNYMSFTDASRIEPLALTSYSYGVVCYKNIGAGKAIFIGSDFSTVSNPFSYILARAIKKAKTTLSSSSYMAPSSGSIAATQTQTANVIINTSGKPAGVYSTTLSITGNNPTPNPYLVPITYTINGSATSSVSANCLYFGSVMQYTNKKDSVLLYNLGCSTMSISSLSNTNSVYTYTSPSTFTIAAWSSRKLKINFTSATVGTYNDTLYITCDGGNKKICLTGTIFSAPTITVSPSALTASLSACNNTQTLTLNVGNIGGSNLTYTIGSGVSTGSVNVLIIANNLNVTNYNNIITALNTYSTNYTITQHTLSNISSLQSALTGKQVLLIPELSYTTGMYQTYSTTIANFANSGGTVIMAGLYQTNQVNDIGLFNSTYNNYVYSVSNINVIDTNNVITTHIPFGNVYCADYVYYNSITNTDAVDYVKYGTYSVVSKRNIGQGRAILLGYSYYYTDLNASRILSNCIKSAGSANPAWLSNSVTNATVTPGSNSVISYTFNSGNLTAGTYTSNVIVSSNDPLTPTYTVPVTMIVNDNPCVNYAFNNPNNCSGIVTFTNNTINTVTSYNWDFGNGTNSALANPTVNYTSSGNYTVTLTACNGTVCSTSSKTLNINGVGGPISNSCTPTSYMYGSNYGILNVTLNSINKTSSYSNPEGYQDFSCNNQTMLTTGNTYTLSVTTSASNYETASAWIDFDNNGIFSPSEQIMNSPASYGTHTLSFTPPTSAVFNTPLRMRVIDEYSGYTIANACYSPYYGQTEDYTVKIQPNNVPPVSLYSTQTNSCTGTVNFTNNSYNNPLSWTWNFGDGGASTLQNPVHTYTTAGTYTVILIATNPYGSSYSTQTITVNPLAFNVSVTGTMTTNEVLTYTTSFTGGLSYTWDFGDGTLSGNQNTSHTYSTAGTYTVKLTIISGNCVNTMSTTIIITSNVGILENTGNIFGLHIFPNPFNNFSSIVLKLENESELNLEIENALGQTIEILTDKKVYEKGEYHFTTNYLANGIYLLKVRVNNKASTYKLISVD